MRAIKCIGKACLLPSLRYFTQEGGVSRAAHTFEALRYLENRAVNLFGATSTPLDVFQTRAAVDSLRLGDRLSSKTPSVENAFESPTRLLANVTKVLLETGIFATETFYSRHLSRQEALLYERLYRQYKAGLKQIKPEYDEVDRSEDGKEWLGIDDCLNEQFHTCYAYDPYTEHGGEKDATDKNATVGVLKNDDPGTLRGFGIGCDRDEAVRSTLWLDAPAFKASNFTLSKSATYDSSPSIDMKQAKAQLRFLGFEASDLYGPSLLRRGRSIANDPSSVTAKASGDPLTHCVVHSRFKNMDDLHDAVSLGRVVGSAVRHSHLKPSPKSTVENAKGKMMEDEEESERTEVEMGSFAAFLTLKNPDYKTHNDDNASTDADEEAAASPSAAAESDRRGGKAFRLRSEPEAQEGDANELSKKKKGGMKGEDAEEKGAEDKFMSWLQDHMSLFDVASERGKEAHKVIGGAFLIYLIEKCSPSQSSASTPDLQCLQEIVSNAPEHYLPALQSYKRLKLVGKRHAEAKMQKKSIGADATDVSESDEGELGEYKRAIGIKRALRKLHRAVDSRVSVLVLNDKVVYSSDSRSKMAQENAPLPVDLLFQHVYPLALQEHLIRLAKPAPSTTVARAYPADKFLAPRRLFNTQTPFSASADENTGAERPASSLSPGFARWSRRLEEVASFSARDDEEFSFDFLAANDDPSSASTAQYGWGSRPRINTWHLLAALEKSNPSETPASHTIRTLTTCKALTGVVPKNVMRIDGESILQNLRLLLMGVDADTFLRKMQWNIPIASVVLVRPDDEEVESENKKKGTLTVARLESALDAAFSAAEMKKPGGKALTAAQLQSLKNAFSVKVISVPSRSQFIDKGAAPFDLLPAHPLLFVNGHEIIISDLTDTNMAGYDELVSQLPRILRESMIKIGIDDITKLAYDLMLGGRRLGRLNFPSARLTPQDFGLFFRSDRPSSDFPHYSDFLALDSYKYHDRRLPRSCYALLRQSDSGSNVSNAGILSLSKEPTACANAMALEKYYDVSGLRESSVFLTLLDWGQNYQNDSAGVKAKSDPLSKPLWPNLPIWILINLDAHGLSLGDLETYERIRNEFSTLRHRLDRTGPFPDIPLSLDINLSFVRDGRLCNPLHGFGADDLAAMQCTQPFPDDFATAIGEGPAGGGPGVKSWLYKIVSGNLVLSDSDGSVTDSSINDTKNNESFDRLTFSLRSALTRTKTMAHLILDIMNVSIRQCSALNRREYPRNMRDQTDNTPLPLCPQTFLKEYPTTFHNQVTQLLKGGDDERRMLEARNFALYVQLLTQTMTRPGHIDFFDRAVEKDLERRVFNQTSPILSQIITRKVPAHSPSSIESGLELHAKIIIDPLAKSGQMLLAFAQLLQEHFGARIDIVWNCAWGYAGVPVLHYSRFVTSPQRSSRVFELEGLATETAVLSLRTPRGWTVWPGDHRLDTDNVRLSNVIELNQRRAKQLNLPTPSDPASRTHRSSFELKGYVLEGTIEPSQTSIPSRSTAPGDGNVDEELPLSLRSLWGNSRGSSPSLHDTVAMKHPNYFQLQVSSVGDYVLSSDSPVASVDERITVFSSLSSPQHRVGVLPPIIARESRKLAPVSSAKPPFEETNKSTIGGTVKAWISGKRGGEEVQTKQKNSLLEVSDEDERLVKKRYSTAEIRRSEEDGETIHIFSLASGHMYERLLRIMIMSVRAHTKRPLKFWILSNFLSADFRARSRILEKSLDRVNFEYVNYAWPDWLNPQTEKQRQIWANKILFLDVLFPRSVRRIIYIDADQIVRGDVAELWETDLHGHAYGFTPFCHGRDKNLDTTQYRFWEQGYWNSHLRVDDEAEQAALNAAGLLLLNEGGNENESENENQKGDGVVLTRPYHISALFVVDLEQFRRKAVGTRLRKAYNLLTRDPNSLANLDQDLPNFSQGQIPIFSLSQEWLWCETWCSQESKGRAKTIDLCNNPLTKEPKLRQAQRIVPEWREYDEKLNQIFAQAKLEAKTRSKTKVEAKLQTSEGAAERIAGAVNASTSDTHPSRANSTDPLGSPYGEESAESVTGQGPLDTILAIRGSHSSGGDEL